MFAAYTHPAPYVTVGRRLNLVKCQGSHVESEDSNIYITGLSKNQVRARVQCLAQSLAQNKCSRNAGY